MSIDTKHPEYTVSRVGEWDLMRDSYEGESAIKSRGETYLPKPSGYSSAGGHPDNGEAAYTAYKKRAQFPDVTASSIGAMIGIIHAEEIQIEMPDALDYLREDIDGGGSTLEDFHKRITRNLLVSGRYGLLADASEDGGEPFLKGYDAKAIINWDDDFFVLDETHMKRDGFTWSQVEQYRVLQLDGSIYLQALTTDGVEIDITPTRMGGGGMDFVPFAIAGAKDLGANVETPPLIGVARAALAMYQLSADYRLQLYMSGQETLVAINAEPPSAVGAGVVCSLMGNDTMTPDLKYVSPECTGIDRHLSAIEHNRDAAVQAGARLFEQSQQSQESGEARSMRFRSETANLQTIAQSSCALLERGLRFIARMKNLDEKSIVVTPPKDLLDTTMTPADAKALWDVAKDGGMSYQTYYENLQRGKIASPERDHDEEYGLIEGQDFHGVDDVTTEPMA